MNHGKSVLVVALLAVAGAGYGAKKYFIDSPPAKIARAYAETFPTHGDENPADDIAIYADSNDPTKSLIIATDRTKGLAVYDLKGSELEFLELGEVENVDLRKNVRLGDREITVVATTDNLAKQVLLFELAAEKPYLRALPGGRFETDVQTQGICLYRNPANGETSVYMIGKERDPSKEAKEKLARLKKAKRDLMAQALGDVPTTKSEKTEKTEKKADKPDVAEGAIVDAARALEDEAAKAAKKAEKKAKREEDKAKEKAEKSAKEKPTKEEEELMKIAEQPTKKNRQWFAVQVKLGVDENGAIVPTVHRRIHLDGECEGAVADDELGALYISEEEKGVWKFAADGPKDKIEVGQIIAKVEFPNPLREDVEGIALYTQPNGQGYIVICCDKTSDFVVLDRQKPHDYIGRFKVTEGDNVDGVDECDGIDITSANLGGAFADGLVVMQDDKNLSAAGTEEKQNFKLVPWAEIKAALER